MAVQQVSDRTTLAEAVFAEANDALFLLDPTTDQLLDVNDAAVRLSGFPRTELLRFQATYLFRHEAQGGKQRLHQATAQTGLFHSEEGYLLRTQKDGVWVPVNLSISRLHVRPKTLALITARDIREQRETHARLKQAEAELRQLTASISDCLWSAEINAAGRWSYRYCSPVLERITGCTATSILAGLDRWESLVHPEDRLHWRELNRRQRDGQPTQAEYRVVWPGGTVRWVRESVAVRRRDDGQGLRLDAVLTDVTERKLAVEGIRQWKERYEAAVRASGHILYDTDVATLMVTYAGSVEESLGFSTAELEGDLNRWVDLVHPDDRAAFVREAKQACAGRAVFHLIYRVRKKDGSYLIVQDNGQAIRDAQGNVQRVIGFVIDITPQRALEEQYRQSQKMEAVGRLAGGIAHDFNNLLTVITGYGQLLQEQFPKGTPTGDIIQEITGAGNRAASLTRQLLAFSRKAILEPKVLDLRELVTDMDRMLRRVIGEDIELVTAADQDLGMVKADPGHVQQVILNLAVNARDAMPQGGKLTVEVRNVELDEEYAQRHPDARPGPHVLLIVRDTGVGMDGATQARIWEPFFTTKGEKGTGLGLATVYGVVRQSGGHIAVESEPGQGATFKVYLPRAQENAPIGKSFHGQTSLTDLPRGTETILSVEDEEGVRVLTRHVLLGCGYQVLEASDGREALRVASLHPGRIHLLLTDVVMPQMGGREVAQRLSTLYPGLKVMYLSGYTDDAVVRHGVQAGEVQLLLKPFSPTALAQKVRQLLDQN